MAWHKGIGTRLTGHVYSNKLNTTLIRKTVPILASNVPMRVVIVFPNASDKNAFSKAKIARMENFIIESSKSDEALRYFKFVGSKLMAG